MTQPYKIGLCQTNSQNDLQANLQQAGQMLAEAASNDAQAVFLPENVAFMAQSKEELKTNSYAESEHPALRFFQDAAKQHSIWLQIGSLAVIAEDQENKLYNRCFMINPSGEVAQKYDKIHLYDVDVEGGERHYESGTFAAGKQSVLCETPFGTIGMNICYDMRFGHLQRYQAKSGANILSIPSAFTKHTGEAHWHALLRARAIETLSFVVAAAQTGSHPKNRSTYGHSLVVSPWGEIIADAGEDVGVTYASIDVSIAEKEREGLPSIHHDRFFS